MSRHALDWNDPEGCAAWLSSLASACLDLQAVAEDQIRPMAHRDLGRRQARAMVAESTHAIDGLIAHARAGLDTPHSDPAGSGDAGPTH